MQIIYIFNNIIRIYQSTIPQSLVIGSFKKCGISNLMDGSEDNFLYETEDEDNNNDEVVNIEDSSAEESDSEVNN